MKLVYTGCWLVGCYIWYSEEGTGRGPSPRRPLLAVPNVTTHPSMASVPITVLLYNGPLLCGFNVGIKGLNKLPSIFGHQLNVKRMTFVNCRMMQIIEISSRDRRALTLLSSRMYDSRSPWVINGRMTSGILSESMTMPIRRRTCWCRNSLIVNASLRNVLISTVLGPWRSVVSRNRSQSFHYKLYRPIKPSQT